MSTTLSRPEHIQTLISSVDRYNPSNCHLLEDYLKLQLANTEYDLLPNLALLKLYQFNPTLLNPTATLSILFLALARAPFSPDFSLAWSLLSDSFAVGAALPPLPLSYEEDDEDDDGDDSPRLPATANGERELAQQFHAFSLLLAARKFSTFWTALNATKGERWNEVLTSAIGVEDALRDCIAVEVSATFRGLARATLERFLGLEVNSPLLAPIVARHHWTLDGDSVKFPENESNTPQSTLGQERIEISHLSKLLARSQAA